jgi:hypothetical protein
MYNAIICWKLKATKSWQLMLTVGKSYEFLFFILSCFFTCYELTAIFKNGDVLSNVAFLIGELCVLWSS